MTTFDFSSLNVVLENLVGAECYEAKAESQTIRDEAFKVSADWKATKIKAEFAEKMAKHYAQMKVDFEKAVEKAWMDYRITGEFKDAASLNYAKGNPQAFYDNLKLAIADLVIDQVPEFKVYQQDFADFREIEPKATFSELLTWKKKQEQEIADIGYADCVELFKEKDRLFAKADQILVNAGLGGMVEQAEAKRMAKKAQKKGEANLEKAVKEYAPK
jgi:hypothetical protein